MKRRTPSSSIKKQSHHHHHHREKRSSGPSSVVPGSSSLANNETDNDQPDVAGNPPLHPSSSQSAPPFLRLNPWWGFFRRQKDLSHKNNHDPKSNVSHATKNNDTHQKKPSRTAMELVVGWLIISATVLALRHHLIPSTTTVPTPLEQQPQQARQKQLESALHQRESKWGDFDGYATITNNYRVLQRLPHDRKDYTQGLQWHNQRLVESTGMYGQSQVKIWDPTTNNNNNNNNNVDKVINLDAKYFGEGLCWFQDAKGRDRYIQLTWQEQTAFVYDKQLELIHQFKYTTGTTEGWGITFDPLEQVFYVSDGSDTIVVWDLDFEQVRSFRVTIALRGQVKKRNGDSYLNLINELEWDITDQTFLANIYFQDAIVRIHPRTGQVLEVWDFSKLYKDRDGTAEVMNGIAHYRGNQWWITGKYWPFLYLVELDSVI